MARKRAYGVNWDPYREEIISLYVKQKKTAKATIQYLQERHGLQVTYAAQPLTPYMDAYRP